MPSRSLRACLGVVALVGLGCATPPAPRALAPKQEKTPTLRERVDACRAEALARNPELEVWEMGRFVARGKRVIGVSIRLPQDSQLEACVRAIPEENVRVGFDDCDRTDESLSVGGFAVEAGEKRPPAPSLEEFAASHAVWEADLRALLEGLIARGALSSADPEVQELLQPRTAAPSVPAPEGPSR